MDDNTLKAIENFIGVCQILGLAYIAYRQNVNSSRALDAQRQQSEQLKDVHTLVNGLAHDKDAAIDSSARAQGELAGRDFVGERERTRRAVEQQNIVDARSPQSTPQPVVIVGTETTVPVVVEEPTEKPHDGN